jgi:hypothetical protein
VPFDLYRPEFSRAPSTRSALGIPASGTVVGWRLQELWEAPALRRLGSWENLVAVLTTHPPNTGDQPLRSQLCVKHHTSLISSISHPEWGCVTHISQKGIQSGRLGDLPKAPPGKCPRWNWAWWSQCRGSKGGCAHTAMGEQSVSLFK